MEPQFNQNPIETPTSIPAPSKISDIRVGVVALTVITVLLVLSIGANIYMGMMLNFDSQATPVTTTQTQDPNYVPAIQNQAGLNSVESTLNNIDPTNAGSGLTQNQTDAGSF